MVLDTLLADYRHSFAQTYSLDIYSVKNMTLSGLSLVSEARVSGEWDNQQSRGKHYHGLVKRNQSINYFFTQSQLNKKYP